MKSVIVTFIYPGSEKYFSGFIDAINDANFTGDVEVIFFNDGIKISRDIFWQLNVKFEIIDKIGTINEIRNSAIEFLQKLQLINIYFQDIDDEFSSNRFLILNDKLESYDLVVNDLKILRNNKVEQNGVWESRLGNDFEFSFSFINDKNIVGLGNSAIKAHLLQNLPSFDNKVIAYDWFFFYQLMKNNNIKGVFTNQCYTHYRQHENNIAGTAKVNSKERVEHILNVKKVHYEALLRLGNNELYNQLELTKNLVGKAIDTRTNLFWWEETSLL